MTRNWVVEQILEVLEPWESCKIEKRTANAVLRRLEKLGVIAPPDRVIGYCVDEMTGELFEVHGTVWEKEGKQEMPKITHVLK